MPFPAVGASPPSLQPWQFSWLGYTIGAFQPLELQKVEGLDMQGVRTGDAGRPRDRGRFMGLDLMDGRDITLTGQILTTGTNWQSLAAVLPPGGAVESPLWFNLPGWGTLASMCRVRKHNMALDVTSALGQLSNITIQFSASDPCLYSTPTLNPGVSPPSSTAGFSFNLGFNLSFGGGSVAGALSINNTGNVDARPILVVTGPCTNPSITNGTTGLNMTFNVTMAAGDQLVVDTDFHTVTYYTSGSTIGANRAYTLVQGSQWWTLIPGVNSIQFLTADSASSGTLNVQYASAYIL